MSNSNKLQQIAQLKKKLAELEAEIRTEENNSELWEPLDGEWTITSRGLVVRSQSEEDFCQFGVERRTEEQATKSRDEMRVFNRLLAYRDEFDPTFVEGEIYDVCGFVPFKNRILPPIFEGIPEKGLDCILDIGYNPFYNRGFFIKTAPDININTSDLFFNCIKISNMGEIYAQLGEK